MKVGEPEFSLREAVRTDLPAILDIHNWAVRESLAIWDERQVSLEDREAWFDARRESGFPIIVAEAYDGEILGYASYAQFRPFQGYLETVEHSVYVRSDRRGQGVGRALLAHIVQCAREQGLYVMIGGIEAGNMASIALHRSLGFVETGRLPKVGVKFGRRLDLVFMQLFLADEEE